MQLLEKKKEKSFPEFKRISRCCCNNWLNETSLHGCWMHCDKKKKKFRTHNKIFKLYVFSQRFNTRYLFTGVLSLMYNFTVFVTSLYFFIFYADEEGSVPCLQDLLHFYCTSSHSANLLPLTLKCTTIYWLIFRLGVLCIYTLLLNVCALEELFCWTAESAAS